MKPIIPDAALHQHIAVLGKTRSGKSSVLRGLVEGLLEREQPVCIVDPKGDWWGIKLSKDGKRPGYPVVIFGGEHADVPINHHAGVVRKTADGKLVWTGVVRPLPFRLDWPLKWRGQKRVFVCSQSDLFNPKVPFDFIAATFGVMAMAPNHTFQVLTKHAARMREFFRWAASEPGGPVETCLWLARKQVGPELANRFDPFPDKLPEWPLENVWLGVTVEDQARANERIPHLLSTPAAKRWLSIEPQLERISISIVTMPAADVVANTGDLPDIGGAQDLARKGHDVHLYDLRGIDWVVCGGESAQTRATTRPFDLQWARDLKEECATFIPPVAFFMKQLGTKPMDVGWDKATPTVEFVRPEGKHARYKWHEPRYWPLELQLQQFPE